MPTPQHVIAEGTEFLDITATQAAHLVALDVIYACPDCDAEDPETFVRTYHLRNDETGWDEIEKELQDVD